MKCGGVCGWFWAGPRGVREPPGVPGRGRCRFHFGWGVDDGGCLAGYSGARDGVSGCVAPKRMHDGVGHLPLHPGRRGPGRGGGHGCRHGCDTDGGLRLRLGPAGFFARVSDLAIRRRLSLGLALLDDHGRRRPGIRCQVAAHPASVSHSRGRPRLFLQLASVRKRHAGAFFPGGGGGGFARSSRDRSRLDRLLGHGLRLGLLPDDPQARVTAARSLDRPSHLCPSRPSHFS